MNKSLNLVVMMAITVSACNSSEQSDQGKDSITISLSPKAMKQLETVDERFQSYNVKLWKWLAGSFGNPII